MPGPDTKKHILPLDGLRGAAVLMVVLYHGFGANKPSPDSAIRDVALYAICRWGYSGVDLFFVLSGFLITGILLKTRDSQNFYKVFYGRRALRIFPLYYLAICIVFFALPMIQTVIPTLGLNTHATPAREQLWFWLNLSNFRTAFVPMIVPQLSHFWTLAIEEQFYLIWPSVVRRVNNRNLRYICVAGFLLPLALRVSKIIPTFGAPNFTYRLTPFHMEGLFAGAALALMYRQMSAKGEGRYRLLFLLSIVLCALGIGCSIAWPNIEALQNSLTTLLAAGFFGLVGMCLLGPGRSFGLAEAFSLRKLRTIGTYSYFMYVFHLLIYNEVSSLGTAFIHVRHLVYRGVYRLPEFFLAVLILYGLAALSNRYLEGPILGLKRYLPYARREQVLAVP